MRLRCTHCNEEMSRKSPTTITIEVDGTKRRFCDKDCELDYRAKKKLEARRRFELYESRYPPRL